MSLIQSSFNEVEKLQEPFLFELFQPQVRHVFHLHVSEISHVFRADLYQLSCDVRVEAKLRKKCSDGMNRSFYYRLDHFHHRPGSRLPVKAGRLVDTSALLVLLCCFSHGLLPCNFRALLAESHEAIRKPDSILVASKDRLHLGDGSYDFLHTTLVLARIDGESLHCP